MGYVEDRWYRTVKDADGRTTQVKTARHGTGMRYRVRYIAPDGKERSESFPDRQKRTADAFLATVESDKVRGTFVDPAAGRMLFGVFAESWLRTATLDTATRETVELRVRKHLLPFFGSRQLAAIQPSTVREWIRALDEAGGLAVSTQAVLFTHLRTILNAAVDDRRITKNPCSARSVVAPEPVEKKIVPWPAERVRLMRDLVPARYRLVLDLGAGCGLRQGEIFGLSDEDLDIEGGWLHVRRQVKVVRSRLVFGLPKSDRERKVPLPGSVIRRINAHREVCKPVYVTLPWEDPFSVTKITESLLLSTPRGNAIRRNTFDELTWNRALDEAGIPRIRANGTHALRHHYASVLLDAGESIKAVSEYLGHWDPGFTLRQYTHLMPNSQERSRSAIDASLDFEETAP
ncbi:tyrosine-type recombinase/integrase [Dactylosporangium vinaceum]|uniref:Tyrosine-type recombinase/integrase n=1 Tax=Dactylosporangium vinaceum TaxID=53362 RepID=A0ABV5MIP3_9ACTN|nr:tyrosine-type recombinase/integrase [Dactylosporangium vinaceum]UAB95139.1 tyrosine-type recombinase/integrase [Dactylosporangium vinaceum]